MVEGERHQWIHLTLMFLGDDYIAGHVARPISRYFRTLEKISGQTGCNEILKVLNWHTHLKLNDGFLVLSYGMTKSLCSENVVFSIMENLSMIMQ